MIFTYNDTKYIIEKTDSIYDLVKRSELLELPLSAWKELFIQKSGVCFDFILSKVLRAKIDYYDTSSNVNSFVYDNSNYWFNKETRNSLERLANASNDNVKLILGENIIEISPEKLKEFLSQLEVYASKCYLATYENLAEIKNLNTIEELINYDYICKYPGKIKLEL